MSFSCCHFNDYGHNYDYIIINISTHMTINMTTNNELKKI